MAWITSTPGHHSFHSSRPSERSGCDQCGWNRQVQKHDHSYPQFTTVDHFPAPSNWQLHGMTWTDLMFIENEIIMGTIVELVRGYCVPCLLIHGNFVIRRKDQKLSSTQYKASSWGGAVWGLSRRSSKDRTTTSIVAVIESLRGGL